LIGLLAFELIYVLSPTLLGLYLSSHFTPCGLERGLSIKVKVAQKKKKTLVCKFGYKGRIFSKKKIKIGAN
jgi:hypothetical protein